VTYRRVHGVPISENDPVNNVLMILPVTLPVLFWAAYHYHKDRHLPEPIANLLLCFLLGIAAAFLSKWLYVSLGWFDLRYDALALADRSSLGLLAYAVFAIGPIEEFAKLLPFVVIVLRLKAFDEPMDGIIYASFIALGYAAMENYHYLQFLTESEAMYRGFAGPVVHILFASVWGYRIGIARLAGRPLLLVSFVAVTIAAVLHGVYDFVVIALPVSALPLSALLILAVWIWRLIAIRRMKRLAGHID